MPLRITPAAPHTLPSPLSQPTCGIGEGSCVFAHLLQDLGRGSYVSLRKVFQKARGRCHVVAHWGKGVPLYIQRNAGVQHVVYTCVTRSQYKQSVPQRRPSRLGSGSRGRRSCGGSDWLVELRASLLPPSSSRTGGRCTAAALIICAKAGCVEYRVRATPITLLAPRSTAVRRPQCPCPCAGGRGGVFRCTWSSRHTGTGGVGWRMTWIVVCHSVRETGRAARSLLEDGLQLVPSSVGSLPRTPTWCVLESHNALASFGCCACHPRECMPKTHRPQPMCIASLAKVQRSQAALFVVHAVGAGRVRRLSGRRHVNHEATIRWEAGRRMNNVCYDVLPVICVGIKQKYKRASSHPTWRTPRLNIQSDDGHNQDRRAFGGHLAASFSLCSSSNSSKGVTCLPNDGVT